MTASQAREKAGLTVEQAARRLRVQPRYLRQIEMHGDAPYLLAKRLSDLYACHIALFLYPPQEHKKPDVRRRRRGR